MWYLADVLLAQPKQSGDAVYHCESCNVAILASDAKEAYRKALRWAQEHAAESPGRMQTLGVSHLTTIGEELGDGVEICGHFFEAKNVWDRINELIPNPDRLTAEQWEQHRDKPIQDLPSADQIAQLRRAFGRDN